MVSFGKAWPNVRSIIAGYYNATQCERYCAAPIPNPNEASSMMIGTLVWEKDQ